MVKDALFAIQERIAAACARSGRAVSQVTLVAVSKGRTAGQIREASDCGLRHIGENRVQEALEKYQSLSGLPVTWHMIGHLQTNKVKQAVRIFECIHSVDSYELACEIDRRAGRINKRQSVLIEVNTSGEAAKYGLPPEQLFDLVSRAAKLPHLQINGLMTVAPIVSSDQQARPYFARLRQLMQQVNEAGLTQQPLRQLSMGMTDDFEVAVEEGATLVRLGRALFEAE